MSSGNTSHTDQFFIDTESAFLAALFAHTSTLPESTPLTAYRLFTRQKPDELLKQLLESPSETAREQANIFMQTDPRYKGAIVPAIAARLQFMSDKGIQRFTSATLDAPDFGHLRREPCAIYWCLREQDIVRLRPLTSLFFTVLLEQLAGEQIPEGTEGVPITMMLDEFANIGVIPDFETTISLARGRGVAIWLGIQSLSQLDKSYGHANAQTIITNCSTKIALHGLDVQTAKYVSEMLGESTVVANRSSYTFSPTGLIGVGRHGTEHRRSLMTPDEVMRLSETEAIIRTGNKYPMKLRKGYYDEKANTAPTSALGAAITADFAPLTVSASPVMPAPDLI
jgi:type IV secretion system protein VirD4